MTDPSAGPPPERAGGGGRKRAEGKRAQGRRAEVRGAEVSRAESRQVPVRRAGRKGAAGRRSGIRTSGEEARAAATRAVARRDFPGISEESALDLLATGTIEVEGRLVVASNATLYCTVNDDGTRAACVYKPVAGERPLWDFPAGTLAGREVAAYAVSRAAGWDVVPPTVFRDGPFGPGMCQLWIDSDPEVDIIALARRADHPGLRAMAVFDAVVNNADRKIGHLLPTPDGHLYGCDHGVCFAEEYKLRTVLWQWRGRRLPAQAVEALRKLAAALDCGPLGSELARWLTAGEVSATRRRVQLLLKHQVHPYPPDGWPAVPWPPL